MLGKKTNNPVGFGAGCVIGVSMGTNSTHFLGLGWDVLFRKRYSKIHHKSLLLQVNEVILEILKCPMGVFSKQSKRARGDSAGFNAVGGWCGEPPPKPLTNKSIP